MTDRSRKRLGRRGKWIFAAGLGVCLLIACELAVRHRLRFSFVAGERWGTDSSILARFDPELGWANESGARARVVTAEISYRAGINALGFRAPPLALEKRGSARRVLFLGDGVAWGEGVDQGDSFTDVLAYDFGSRVECINAAVPGYGTDQELWTLDARGDALQPDLVLLVFVLDDIVDCESSERRGRKKPRFVLQRETWNIEGLPVPDERGPLSRWFEPTLAELGAHSALWTGWQRWRQGEPHHPGLEPKGRPYRPQFAERVRLAAETLFENHSPVRHALGLMRSWCARREIPFAVLVLPHGHDQYLYEPANERPDFDGSTALTKALEKVGAELGFPVVNVDALMFAATGEGQTLHCGDGHLNIAGHVLVADALEPKIVAWLFPAR